MVKSGRTSIMNPAKRRRLEQPQPAINKPFRSPLRSAITTSSNDQNPSPSTPTSTRLPQTNSVALPAAPSSSSDGITSVSKQLSGLSLQLHKLKQKLDVFKQALQIETSGADKELHELIDKWKKVAQEGAEEVFADTKDRIDGMGGLAAWRKHAEEDNTAWTGSKRVSIQPRENYEDTAGESSAIPDSLDVNNTEFDVSLICYLVTTFSSALISSPQSYSMDMMLRQMNIDLELIGFDVKTEGWV